MLTARQANWIAGPMTEQWRNAPEYVHDFGGIVLSDGLRSEPADLESEDSVRAQIKRWAGVLPEHNDPRDAEFGGPQPGDFDYP